MKLRFSIFFLVFFTYQCCVSFTALADTDASSDVITIDFSLRTIDEKTVFYCDTSAMFHEKNVCRAAQVTLQGLGYNMTRRDGVFSKHCTKSLIHFQRRNRIPDHGYLDAKTLRALNLA